jgi:hypothetical protein
MSLSIPLPVWEAMRSECKRRSTTAGGSVSLSMLVVQMVNESLLRRRRVDGHATASAAGAMAAQ